MKREKGEGSVKSAKRRKKIKKHSQKTITSIYLSALYPEFQNFYSITPNFSTTQDTSLQISPIASFNPNSQYNYHAASCILGSKIYVFGGFSKNPSQTGLGLGLRDVFVCKLNGKNKWKSLPPMLAPRAKPKVITCGGNIYVLGCSRSHTSELVPWGEVFNPKAKLWSPLPPLPSIFLIGRGTQPYIMVYSSVVLPDQKKFLAYLCSGELACFDVKQLKWERLTHVPTRDQSVEFPVYPYMVAVYNLLYMFLGLNLFVYDWNNPKDKLNPVYGGFPKFTRPLPFSGERPVFPFHLGDRNFCLVWCPSGNSSKRYDTEGMIFCLKFRIDQNTDFGGKCYYYATFLGCEIFAPDAGPIYWEYAAI